MAHASSQPMLLQLLGAPRLIAGDQAVHVGSRKALAILAVLALEGSATRDRLAALLWPEADAPGRRRNLRQELFRLRRLAVPLTESADGVLGLDAALAVDAHGLLRDQGLPDTSGVALEGLDGVGSAELDEWLQRWRDELAHRQGQMLLRLADACEQRGESALALPLQMQRWAADACNESAALAVVRLQAALGDRAAALQSYQRLVDALRDELDIAPSEPAQALARGLRKALGQPASPPPARDESRKAALHPTAADPAAPGLPARVPFVPRRAAQAQIEAAWSRGLRVYLHGTAGTGKTRLASEVAAARGPWLRVACEPQDVELPYSSVVRLLRALRDSAPDVELPDWVRRELSQLMPELGSAPQALATDEARQRLLAAVAAAWTLLVQDNFSALVLDDWHWGDAASVELWARLDEPAQALPAAARVASIVSYRSAQLPEAALQRQRSDVDSGRGVAVALEGMDGAEVLALTRALSGSSGGLLFSQRLHAATEGNPFFLLETLRHLFGQHLLFAEAGGWSTPFDENTQDYAELPVPPSVRAAVIARVRALGGPVQRLLETASLCSGAFDARLLGGAGGLDQEPVIAALEHAEAAQLVQDSVEGWRFAHDLVRQSLVHSLSPARRRLLHERLARQLEHSGAAPALVAAQWEEARQGEAAVRWRVAAAESALRVHALGDALAHYAQALADGARGLAAAAIHLACAEVHARRTERDAADAALAAAVEASAGDAAAAPGDLLAVQLARVDHLRETDRGEAALSLLDALAPELARAAPEQQARALAARGSALMLRGSHNEAQSLLNEAVGLLEGLPAARPRLAALLLELTRAGFRRGDLVAARRLAERAVAVHESIDAPSGLASSLAILGVVLIHGGERPQSLAALRRARALAERCGNVPAHRGAILNLVKVLVDEGDTDQASALLDEGAALAPTFEHRRAELAFREARFYLYYLRGELAPARAEAERLLAFSDRGSGPFERIGARHLVVELYLLEGDLDAARRILDEAQALCDAQQAGADGNLFDASQAIRQAWLAHAEGRAADALARLPPVASLERMEDRFACAWVGCAAARALGDLGDAQRRLDSVDLDADVAVDQIAPWLEQRLALAAAAGRADPVGVARGLALLEQRRLPALLSERMRRAVAACSGAPAA